MTHVKNAYGVETLYLYDENDRIDFIDKYTKEGNTYTRDKLYWNGHQLTARLLIAQAQRTLAAHTYEYDPFGNVTVERLWGNLSGENSVGPHISHAGVGHANGCECYEKRFFYDTSNGLNLLHHETDGRQAITSLYCPCNDKLSAKLYWGEGHIYKREFFEYNSNLAMTKQIVDDGCSENSFDLTDVTERHITLIKPRTVFAVGLPEIIEKRCLDMSTGQELLIGFDQLDYTVQGWLKSKTHFDRNGMIAYALNWEYD